MNVIVPTSGFRTHDAKRADQQITDSVSHAWQRSGYMDLRGLECEFAGGTVTIKGQVGSYYLKQMAQAIAARVEGVSRINNQLQVA